MNHLTEHIRMDLGLPTLLCLHGVWPLTCG